MSRYGHALFALALSFTGYNANAQSDLTPEASALQRILFVKLGTNATNDSAWRASLANALHEYCESILTQIPRNTPQENHWVDDEIRDVRKLADRATDPSEIARGPVDSESDRRLSRVLNSAEYARQSMRKIFSECSAIAKSIPRPKQAPPAEALLWIRLARPFLAPEEIWRLKLLVWSRGLAAPV
jgi:hypothetical protein